MKTILGALGSALPVFPIQINNIRLDKGGTGVKIAQGCTITITIAGVVDVYEFRDSTPPAGGTAGRIWVYNGANAAASRVNIIDAINGVVAAARISRGDGTGANPGTNVSKVLAGVGTDPGKDVAITSALAVGGAFNPSPVAIACATAGGDALDVWDAASSQPGALTEAITKMSSAKVTITAAMIAKGSVTMIFPFVIKFGWVLNETRPQIERLVISAGAGFGGVALTLAGGGAPNNQPNDVVDFFAVG